MTNLTIMLTKFMNSNTASTSGSGTLPSNTINNPKVDLKGITTRSGVAYQGPTIPTSSSPSKVVERETEVTKDTVPPTNNRSTKDVQPLVVQVQPQIPNSEPVVAPIRAPMPNLKQSITYPSRRNVERRREKANDQIEKFYEIFKDLSFEISLTDALILMPKFASTLKALIGNKEKLSEMARTPLNEHCSAVILNKLPEKLGDPDRSITQSIGIAEDVYLKVGKFKFSADIIVVDFDVDPRVPLILGRSFLKTGRALIDVYEVELTLHVGKEDVTFNLDQTSRYSSNYDDMTANRIDVIEMACKEYSQEVLGFSDKIASGNPTPYYDPIVSTSSSTLTPFGDSDFILEEVDAFLALKDDPTSPEVDDSYYDPEGDIILLESFLNDDPSPPLPNQGKYLPEIRKELKVCEAKTDKSSIDEPLEVELKDLPPHLEYAFLEGDNKLPIIIAKDLSVKEKAALIKVLKSHKRAIAWKLSDIKGINPEFCTHKILMEEDYKPAVQHQRRVNPKIHDVIKKEVEKLLDAGLIYPISDSPWVSPVHCVPKKGGFTVVANDENELIPTRLVTGWRVCIDYRKLNEATRKDHFPLPFMDQMLERLAGNDYYCFLDGFSGYFQIPIDPKDQEKTTFTCPYGTFAYRRMPFGLCNAPGTFQRCMLAIFHDMVEKTMEEKSHFMVKEGIVLGHKISKNGIEVDKAKVDVIAKLPHPTTVKGVRSFLGHAGFYRRFIQDFSKIARPITHLLKKETPFFFSKECIESFNTLKRKLTEAPILIAPDWDLPFELMCDASDFAIEAVLGQRKNKHFQPIHYASKIMTEAQAHYTTTENELLVVYLFAKKDVKPRLMRWILLLQEFNVIIRDKKGAENLAADHLSRLENSHQDKLENKEITGNIPSENSWIGCSFRVDSTPWFANLANYHAGNFIVKGIGVCTANKLSTSSKLATMDPPGDIMVQISPPKRSKHANSRSKHAKSIENITDMLSKFLTSNTASTSGSGTLPSNTVTNPKEDLKGITTRSGVAYKGPTIPITSSPKVVEREPESLGGGPSISEPIGIAEDVYVTWRKVPISSRFVVHRFEPDLPDTFNSGRSFLKTSRALIDVYEGEITLRVGREAITFNLDQTSRYTANYNHMTANRIDVIDMACEEYSQEVLGFSNMVSSGNPTPYYDPIVSTVSPTLTPFGDSDFLLFEEADSFLALEDDPTSPEVDPTYYDPEGDILLLEAILNSDPSPPPPNQGNYFPETRKDLKICEANSSVNEPPEVELKDLPPHLEYAFLEGDDKLPVIIAKDLKNEEKAALIEVLKSHKRAIAWKLSDIKGIDPEFCTHKILMEEDYEPTVQHQRRVNPKIHDVIKKEVEKLLDAGLIYPISDSPWVSPVHCVPKKGGMTVVKNDENDLIPTRLVTGWRVCIDYRKLNEATRKDHFPLPFMDQMLERLAGNQFYCFLDGFSGYFQIPIDPKDQEKTTFTCPYGTFAYRRMPFGLCNAPGTFQRCMMAIFHDMIEKMMEVFMDDFSVFGDSFSTCLSHLDKMLKRCEDTNLVLN
ncbi:reverse transcriptase domain-containing protein [Tanacetum coccineum]